MEAAGTKLPSSPLSPLLQAGYPLAAPMPASAGCVWQHIDYPYQLRHKQARLEALFSPILSKDAAVLPIIGCSSPWRYRNKMEFSFARGLEGKAIHRSVLMPHRGGF